MALSRAELDTKLQGLQSTLPGAIVTAVTPVVTAAIAAADTSGTDFTTEGGIIDTAVAAIPGQVADLLKAALTPPAGS